MRNSKSREKHFPIQEDWTLHQKFNLNIFSEKIDPIPISNLTNRKNHKTNRRVRCVYDIVTLFKQLLRKVLKTKVHFYIRHLIKWPKKMATIISKIWENRPERFGAEVALERFVAWVSTRVLFESWWWYKCLFTFRANKLWTGSMTKSLVLGNKQIFRTLIHTWWNIVFDLLY